MVEPKHDAKAIHEAGTISRETWDSMTPTPPPTDDKLLGCPFCGGNSIRRVAVRDGCRMGCEKCGGMSGSEFHGRLTDPPAHERAIAAWNTRAALAPTQPGPDDEALIEAAMEAMALYVRCLEEDEPQVLEYVARKKEALRHHIAELRAAQVPTPPEGMHYELVKDGTTPRQRANHKRHSRHIAIIMNKTGG